SAVGIAVKHSHPSASAISFSAFCCSLGARAKRVLSASERARFWEVVLYRVNTGSRVRGSFLSGILRPLFGMSVLEFPWVSGRIADRLSGVSLQDRLSGVLEIMSGIRSRKAGA